MKLYISNCTQQVQDFVYRLPETSGTRTQRIDIGGQIIVSGDLNPTQIDSILDQHAKYGLVSVDEVDRTRPFIGLCFSVDKPVIMDKVRRAMEHNTTVLNDRGRQLREEAAIFVNNQINDGTNGALSSLEMSVTEKPVVGSDQEMGEQRVTVSRNAEGPRTNGKSNKRQR